jgi:hypothetical protein
VRVRAAARRQASAIAPSSTLPTPLAVKATARSGRMLPVAGRAHSEPGCVRQPELPGIVRHFDQCAIEKAIKPSAARACPGNAKSDAERRDTGGCRRFEASPRGCDGSRSGSACARGTIRCRAVCRSAGCVESDCEDRTSNNLCIACRAPSLAYARQPYPP